MKRGEKIEHIVMVALGGAAVLASIGIIISGDIWLKLAGIALGLLNVHTVVKHSVILYENILWCLPKGNCSVGNNNRNSRKYRNAIEMNISGIKCDAIGCDYRDPSATFAQYQDYVDKPCPKCGANLLTKADYDAAMKIKRIVKWLNIYWKIFHPYKTLTEPHQKATMRMNGKGFAGISLYDEEGRELR
jgi:hypothetical protein